MVAVLSPVLIISNLMILLILIRSINGLVSGLLSIFHLSSISSPESISDPPESHMP